MILLSLALVVASAATLAIGVFSTGDAYVWMSLGAGLGAAALVAGSVVRRRRSTAALTDPAGPASAGAVVLGPASAGVDPAPSPTPSRAVSAGLPAPDRPAPDRPAPARPAPPARPAAGEPDPDPDTVRGARPAVDTWPWATAPPAAEPGAARGWTGHVPSTRPAPSQAAASPPSEEPAAGGLADGAVTGAEVVEDGVEVVAVRDALRVAQLGDEVVVEDGRPRYHLPACPTLAGAATVPLPVSAARRGGFTPCAVCTPDRVLLGRHTDRRADPR